MPAYLVVKLSTEEEISYSHRIYQSNPSLQLPPFSPNFLQTLTLESMEAPASFTDFPDDVQLNILSFLSPLEISAFACTSRYFSSLCSPKSPSSSLYLSMCNRRWGSKTLIPRWTSNFPLLYRTLDRWDPLIGFWRQIGISKNLQSPPLVLFEWGPSCITASRVSPSGQAGSYGVVKKPFLWLGISKSGEPVSFWSGSDPDSDSLVPVSVSFMGGNYVVVEESGAGLCLDSREGEDFRGSGSPPDELTFEIYQYFANRTSPGRDKGLRKQRKKKAGMRRWDAKHFVKIENCCPSPARPFQGLWKGICENMYLDFYLVTYDDVGGITCRRVVDSREPFSGISFVFWTSNTAFLDSPFSREEEELYISRQHFAPNLCDIERGVVSRILCMNSCYDLVLPNLSGYSGDPQNVEGRIWEYEDGTFGFGFLRNKFIVDLKQIALNGRLLDAVEYCGSSRNRNSSPSP